MKSYREIIELCTAHSEEIVNITDQVRGCCEKSDVREGIALVFPHHTSSAVYISDSDSLLTEDLRRVLKGLVPPNAEYAHDTTDPKLNAHAHLWAILTGHHCMIPVTHGELDLGTYQTIYYAEFDGRRTKEIVVKITGE